MQSVHPLKEFRTTKGLTLEELAERVGTTAATLSRIERRKHSPSMALAAKLKSATGLRADEFLPEAENVS